MKTLPTPTVYEQETEFMPWGTLIREILLFLSRSVPRNARVADFMCGPGQLLGMIHKNRPDLQLVGVDIDTRYIRFARRKYPKIRFYRADATVWRPKKTFDVVLCTAGLHHIPYARQQRFLRAISERLRPDGLCVLADPYIKAHRTELERRLAAARLGYEYLRATLLNGAPDKIVSATIDIMHNDVLSSGEYKTYTKRVAGFANKYFRRVSLHKTWPRKQTGYGDYYFLLKK